MYVEMSELSAKLATLKGKRKTSEILKGTNISRGSFRAIERGDSVRLSTLREVATALYATDADWIDLLVAWLKSEAGYDARRIWIEAKESGPSRLRDADAGEVARATMLFEGLNHNDRVEITKAMQRPEVRACLPAINSVWEKLSTTDRLSSVQKEGSRDPIVDILKKGK